MGIWAVPCRARVGRGERRARQRKNVSEGGKKKPLSARRRGRGAVRGSAGERRRRGKEDGRGWAGGRPILTPKKKKKKKKTFPSPSTRAHRPAMAADGPIPPAAKADIDAAFSGPAESLTERTLRPRPPADAYAFGCVPGRSGPQVCCFFSTAAVLYLCTPALVGVARCLRDTLGGVAVRNVEGQPCWPGRARTSVSAPLLFAPFWWAVAGAGARGRVGAREKVVGGWDGGSISQPPHSLSLPLFSLFWSTPCRHGHAQA